ncbi:MAG: hypothetical protein WC798_02410 [Candidatus Paceibacterota bacterium]|jgi:predicted GH43/DUF377 family glycosyl hydrolase
MSFLFFVNIVALLFSLFVVGAILGIAFSRPLREKVATLLRHLVLDKHLGNPILKPGKHPWTAEAVLNPAAAIINGRTHLIYRAIGTDGISRLGYASSADGIVFDTLWPYPAFVAQNPRASSNGIRRYSPVLYPSGGSWGGCEDPRMVLLDGRVYITFNIFDGWDFIRVAAISIAEDDLVAHRFEKWDGPYLLSQPKQVHKNWVLFPEKINGRFAILHSITPKIDIAYRDSIEDIGTEEPLIDSWVGARGSLPVREHCWDTFVRGAGPPPIKTPHGWLLFYHAVDSCEPNRYKLGAMLLDLNDPTHVLHRSAAPIISPDERYENEGKPGVVYACGATVQNGTLFIYYGGADKVVCVATAPLDAFLDALIEGSQTSLVTIPAQTT